MLLLYEFSRGNQVDGSPRVAITDLGGDRPFQKHCGLVLLF